MTKLLQIFLLSFLGAIVGAIIWTAFISIIIAVVIYNSGYIQIEIFGAGGVEPKIPIIAGAVLGTIQGLFIGLCIGIFNINIGIKGSLTGFVVTEILLLMYYIISSLLTVLRGKSFLRSLDFIGDSNFVFFSALLLLPAVLIGFGTVKIFALYSSMSKT